MSPSNLQGADPETIPHSSSEGPSRRESQSPTVVTSSLTPLRLSVLPLFHPSQFLPSDFEVEAPQGQCVSCSLVPENLRLSPRRAWSLKMEPRPVESLSLPRFPLLLSWVR